MRHLLIVIGMLLTGCAQQPAPAEKSSLFYESEGYQTHLKARIDRAQRVITLQATVTNLTTRPLSFLSHPHFYTLTISPTALSGETIAPSPEATGAPAEPSDLITLRPGESHSMSRDFSYLIQPDGSMEIRLDKKRNILVAQSYLTAQFRYEMFAERLPSPLPPHTNYQVSPLSAEILFPRPD